MADAVRYRVRVDGLAERLVTRRKALGLSQDAVGARAGMTGTQVGHYEHGRASPSAAALRDLAVALECSADALLGLEAQNAATRLETPATPQAGPGLTWDHAAQLAEAVGAKRFTWQGTLYVQRRSGWEALP